MKGFYFNGYEHLGSRSDELNDYQLFQEGIQVGRKSTFRDKEEYLVCPGKGHGGEFTVKALSRTKSYLMD
jgi:hypothetical protein